MPVFGTGPKRTDGKINPLINATIRYLSSPNTISNLSFWFDANDNATIDLQFGNTSNIYGWRSKGSYPILISTAATIAPAVANNAVVPYIVPNGLNGKQTIFFSGISSILMTQSTCSYTAIATNNETTIFTVLNPTNGGTIFAYENYFGNRCTYIGGSFLYGNYIYNAVNVNGPYSGIGYYQQTFYKRNSDSKQVIKFKGSLNNSGTNTLSMTANQTFALGGIPGGIPAFPLNNPGNLLALTGNIGEVLLYNRGLTDDEIVGVEGYLAKKWGIQNQLRFNHIGVATGPPLMGYKLITYPRLVANYGLWYDAMDTSTIKDVGGNFPPLLPPNALGLGQWNDKSGNNKHLSNFITNPSQFNLMSPGTFYPAVYSPGYVSGFPTLGGYFNLRNNFSPSLYIGCNISAFFVLSINSNNPPNAPVLGFTSSFSPMPSPLGGNQLLVNSNSTFDFTLVFNGSNIGLSRFGNNTSNNIVSAPYNGTNSLISLHVNGTQNTTGNVLPSTNLISINGAFVSSSSFYAGNNFNFQWLSLFGIYNNPTQNTVYFNEVAVFYRTLTTPERLLIENQLINKWKLPSNAPVSFINSLPVSSGLFGWYDAYDQTTVLRNSSNNVSMWLDKSGQNNHMSTNLLTYGSNTRSNIYYSSISISTNQFPSLYFPSTFAFMQTSSFITNQSLSTFTMMAVTRGTKIPINTNRTVTFFSTLNDLERAGATLGVPNNQVVNTTVTVNQNSSNYSTFHINTLLANIGPTTDTGIASGNAVSYFNGSNSNLATGLIYSGMLTPSYIRLMASAFTDEVNGDPRTDAGYLSEVLLYNRILTSTELTNTHTYLLNKWNISTLVSNVPVTRGLNLWLDAYDPASVITDSNSNILLWRDKSLCNFNFSNVNAGTAIQPQTPIYRTNANNNLPGLLFTSDYASVRTSIYNCNFNFPSQYEATYFSVFQSRALNKDGYLFTLLSNNENIDTTAFGFRIAARSYGVGINRSSFGVSASINTTVPTLVTGVFNSSFSSSLIPDIPQNNWAVGYNGIIGATNISSGISTIGNGAFSSIRFSVGQAMMGARTPVGVDVTTYFDGYMHETLLYNRTLSFVERQQVESYLMSKWKI